MQNDITANNIKDKVLELRKQARLHPTVADKIKEYFEEVLPGARVLLERGSITSGRPDACIYEWNDRSIYVEIIATKSNVFRDLVNLLQSEADLSIAVLLDEEFEVGTQEEYHSKSKNKFPWFNVSEFLLETKKERTIEKLHELFEKKTDFIEESDIDDVKFKKLIDDNHIKEPFQIKISMGIFPHKKLKIYDKESNVDLHIGFQKYQLSQVVQPTVLVGRYLFPSDCGFENTPEIYYDHTGHEQYNGFCSKVLIHRDGKIIKTVYYDPLVKDKLFFIESFNNNFVPLIPFSSWILSDKGLKASDNVDVWVYLKGLKDRVIVLPREPENISYAFLGEKIYSDEICIKMGTFSTKELSEVSFYKRIEGDLIACLKQYAK